MEMQEAFQGKNPNPTTQLWLLQQGECQQLNGYYSEGISLDRRETCSLTPISAQSQISPSRKAGNTTKPSNSQAIVTTQPSA